MKLLEDRVSDKWCAESQEPRRVLGKKETINMSFVMFCANVGVKHCNIYRGIPKWWLGKDTLNRVE